MIKVVAFDADDTLWHNEDLFLSTRDRFTALLTEYHSREWVEQHLYETELKNLKYFGYGIKGFTLSMIETAIELSESRVTAEEISRIISLGRDMHTAPMRVFDGAMETVRRVGEDYRTAVVTKGDLFDQETKLARSGIGELVDAVEVVSEKDVETYQGVVNRLGVTPSEFVMIGNSMRSDVVPVATMGGHAVHVPYETEWAHEAVEDTALHDLSFHRIDALADVLPLLNNLANGTGADRG